MKVFYLILSLALLPLDLLAQEWEFVGPNSRVMRHQDGSRTYYKRNSVDKMLVKKNVGTDGRVRLITHYYMDDFGNPRACHIFNSANKMLFKAKNGYQPSTGRLMEEQMLFADRVDPKTGQPLIASRTRYTYDAQGNRSKPMIFTFVEGQTAESLYGKKTTLPDKVFDDQNDIANPNAKRVGKK